MIDEKDPIEVEFEHVPSDRIELIKLAVEFVGLFQNRDTSISDGPADRDLEAYTAAIKLLRIQFAKGPSTPESVVTKRIEV